MLPYSAIMRLTDQWFLPIPPFYGKAVTTFTLYDFTEPLKNSNMKKTQLEHTVKFGLFLKNVNIWIKDD